MKKLFFNPSEISVLNNPAHCVCLICNQVGDWSEVPTDGRHSGIQQPSKFLKKLPTFSSGFLWIKEFSNLGRNWGFVQSGFHDENSEIYGEYLNLFSRMKNIYRYGRTHKTFYSYTPLYRQSHLLPQIYFVQNFSLIYSLQFTCCTAIRHAFSMYKLCQYMVSTSVNNDRSVTINNVSEQW